MAEDSRSLAFACPRCSSPLPVWNSGVQTCAACGSEFARRAGIYRCLLPERLHELQPFLAQYRLVREKDGYRLRSPAYYLALPTVDPRDPQAQTWRVRRESFDHLCRRVLPGLNRRPLTVLDLGAGNGWLSHRLSELGHRCVAVDWLDDDEDGLGVHVHYPVKFTCVQADFDRLPFRPRLADLVVFNGSLHYSPDPRATLQRACQRLAPGGALVIMDSPLFPTDEGGRQMLAKQDEAFAARYGLKDIVRTGVGYLTFHDLDWLATQLAGVRFFPSRGGFRWSAKRYLAGLKQRREPAAFGVAVGFVRGESDAN